MATDQRSLPAYFNTNADFQAWCQGINAQFVVAGMAKTTDTGQINNATVSKPGAGSTVMGYEVWKFTDALQASYPVFFKIEYASGGSADQPAVWITVGQGSDGAGNLTGQTTTRRFVYATASKSAGVTLPSYCSGDGSRLGLVVNYDSASNSFGIMVVIDRLRDGTGAATTDGVTNVLAGAAGSQFQTHTILGGTSQTAQTGAAFVGTLVSSGVKHGGGASSNAGGVAMLPAIVLSGQIRFLLALAFYNSADIAGNASVTPTMLGASHTYQTFPKSASASITVTSTDAPALLWE